MRFWEIIFCTSSYVKKCDCSKTAVLDFPKCSTSMESSLNLTCKHVLASLTYKFPWNMPFEDEILDLGAHDDDDDLEEEAMFYEVKKSCNYLL